MLYFTAIFRIPIFYRYVCLKSPLYSSLTTEAIATLNHINFGSLSWENVRMIYRHYVHTHQIQLNCLEMIVVWLVSAWNLRFTEARFGLLTCSLETLNYKYLDMAWLVPITMTTIGYGDMYPKSKLGRCLMVCCGFYGLLFTAQVVSILTNNLRMTRRERQIYNVLESNRLKKDLRTKAAIVLQRIWRRYKYRLDQQNSILLEMNRPNNKHSNSLADFLFNANFISKSSVSGIGHGNDSDNDAGVVVNNFTRRLSLAKSQKKLHKSDTIPNNQHNVDNYITMEHLVRRMHTHVPLIRDQTVLESLTQFRTARIKKKYISSDNIDLIDIGIKQNGIDGKIDLITKKVAEVESNLGNFDHRLHTIEVQQKNLNQKLDLIMNHLKIENPSQNFSSRCFRRKVSFSPQQELVE